MALIHHPCELDMRHSETRRQQDTELEQDSDRLDDLLCTQFGETPQSPESGAN